MPKHPSKEWTAVGNLALQKRHGVFLGLNVVLLLVFYSPLSDLMRLAHNSHLYSHVPLIPLVSAYLLYSRRKDRGGVKSYAVFSGISILMLSLVALAAGKGLEGSVEKNDVMAVLVMAAVVFWIGSFVLCYGVREARRVWFPLCFLVFMIPIPTVLLDGIVAILQWGSANAAHGILALTGVPFVREGFLFHLPGLSVFVAEECSGIRSSLVFFIISVLSSHLFLRSMGKKVILISCVLPITILKNSMRITAITLLSAYVDRGFLSGPLHTSGGILFFGIALTLWIPILWFLRRREKKQAF
jgi:exosortase